MTNMTNMTNDTGSLKIILGCMFSGKTSELVHTSTSYVSIGTNVMNINYALDDRYDKDSITTHNKEKINSLNILNLVEIKNNNKYKEIYDNSEIICINEAQFFSDLKDCVLEFCYIDKKKIFICGLDGDYQQKPFGQILDLIPHAESVTKLTAFCGICKNGTLAHFTKRIVKDDNQILIGATDKYIPVCRKHIHNS
jgi:thymidine kinase